MRLRAERLGESPPQKKIPAPLSMDNAEKRNDLKIMDRPNANAGPFQGREGCGRGTGCFRRSSPFACGENGEVYYGDTPEGIAVLNAPGLAVSAEQARQIVIKQEAVGSPQVRARVAQGQGVSAAMAEAGVGPKILAAIEETVCRDGREYAITAMERLSGTWQDVYPHGNNGTDSGAATGSSATTRSSCSARSCAWSARASCTTT